MTVTHQSLDASPLAVPTARRAAARARTVAAAGVVFPAAVLLHEGAHYLAARLFGFHDVALHYAAATYDGDAFWNAIRAGNLAAARLLLDPAHAAIVSALGPLTTYAVLAVCVSLARSGRLTPHDATAGEPSAWWGALLGLGLATPLRSIAAAPRLVLMALGHTRPSGTDEGQVAAITGVPEALLQLLGLCTLLAGWYLLLRTGRRLGGRGYVARVVLGTILGAATYIGLVGPRLLP
ncbi:MAG: hypothetical protein JO180_02805 [Gemmatirosa sp.]|nr:hypothetical protein [Gemmatirosa sp.]